MYTFIVSLCIKSINAPSIDSQIMAICSDTNSRNTDALQGKGKEEVVGMYQLNDTECGIINVYHVANLLQPFCKRLLLLG